MLYLKCPSCKKNLGDIQIQYELILNRICKDEEMGNINTQEANNLKSKLILSFGLNRYCCNTRLMTYKQLVNIVK